MIKNFYPYIGMGTLYACNEYEGDEPVSQNYPYYYNDKPCFVNRIIGFALYEDEDDGYLELEPVCLCSDGVIDRGDCCSNFLGYAGTYFNESNPLKLREYRRSPDGTYLCINEMSM